MSQSSFGGFISPRPDKKGIPAVKSVQYGTSAFSASTTVNVTISSVDITKSIVLPRAYMQSNVNVGLVQGTLTSSTNAQFTSNSTQSSTFPWMVVEFLGIKSFQSGNFVNAAANVTISTVNVSKALLFFNYKSTGSSTNLVDSVIGGYLSAPTTINFNSNSAVNFDVNWYVVEML